MFGSLQTTRLQRKRLSYARIFSFAGKWRVLGLLFTSHAHESSLSLVLLSRSVPCHGRTPQKSYVLNSLTHSYLTPNIYITVLIENPWKSRVTCYSESLTFPDIRHRHRLLPPGIQLGI